MTFTRRRFISAAGASAIGCVPFTKTRLAEAASATQRPISDFVDAQGTTSVFVPPVGDFLGWTSGQNAAHEVPPPAQRRPLFASVDYAGLADKWLGRRLGTHTSGKITERPLADGRVEISVVLHTRNALTWAMDLDLNDPQFATRPLLFGYRAPEVLAGSTPALGESHFELVFRWPRPPGFPMPDLARDFFISPVTDLQLLLMFFRSNASGPLRALYGVAEGTPGRCVVTQTGIFRTPFKGALQDAFPAERIDLHVTGRN